MSGGMPGGEIVSSSDYTIDTDQPENLGSSAPQPAQPEAPQPEAPLSEEEFTNKAWSETLELASRSSKQDDYERLRESDILRRKGHLDYHKAERVIQRGEIVQRAQEIKNKDIVAELEKAPETHAAREYAAYEQGMADKAFADYERHHSPGLGERTQELAAQYGTVSPTAAKLIDASGYGPQIWEKIAYADDPGEVIRATWTTPLHELCLGLGQAIGQIQEREGSPYLPRVPEPEPEPPPIKRFSSAPPPVTTIGGKSHQSGKTPDQMSYEEYKRWRGAQIAAKRPKGTMGGGR